MTTDAENRPEETEPDYRFSYANERTFLAYIRTSMAFIGGGVAATQLLPDSSPSGTRTAIGVLLVTAGALLAVLARRQWHANQQAMRRGEVLPRSSLTTGLTAAVVAIAVFVLAIVLLH